MIARLPMFDRCCANCSELLVDVSHGAICHDDAGNAYCCHGCRGEALETLAAWRNEDCAIIPAYPDEF